MLCVVLLFSIVYNYVCSIQQLFVFLSIFLFIYSKNLPSPQSISIDRPLCRGAVIKSAILFIFE